MEASNLRSLLRKHYEEEGKPLIGGITPEMIYYGCLEKYGLK